MSTNTFWQFLYLIFVTMIATAECASKVVRKAFGKVGSSAVKDTVSKLASDKPPFVMFASIGNPEPQYEDTRHNVAHWFMNDLIERRWLDFNPFSVHRNLPYGEHSVSQLHPNVLLFRSIFSFMNLQGTPISKTWKMVKEAKSLEMSPALVVLHDDLQLPLGKIQIRRQNTSARGHNGLRSINSKIDMGYSKISIGIGKPKSQDAAKYVLSKFEPYEKEVLYHEVFPKIANTLEEMRDGQYIYDVYKGD